MSYTPQPGTIPARVIDILTNQPAGSKLSTGMLAEILGQPVNGLSASLKAAREHGALLAEFKPDNRSVIYWSLGAGKPLPKVDSGTDEPLDKLPVPKRKTPSARSVFEIAKQAEPARDFGFMFSSTGHMALQKGAQRIELGPSEVTQLAEFAAKITAKP